MFIDIHFIHIVCLCVIVTSLAAFWQWL